MFTAQNLLLLLLLFNRFLYYAPEKYCIVILTALDFLNLSNGMLTRKILVGFAIELNTCKQGTLG